MFSHSWSQFGKALKSLCIPSHLCSIFFKSSVFLDLKPAGYPFQRAQFTCLSESHLILSRRVLGSKPHSADFFFSLLSSSRKECWKPYTPHLPLPLVSQEVEHAPLSLSTFFVPFSTFFVPLSALLSIYLSPHPSPIYLSQALQCGLYDFNSNKYIKKGGGPPYYFMYGPILSIRS